jgi:hypothetical protein
MRSSTVAWFVGRHFGLRSTTESGEEGSSSDGIGVFQRALLSGYENSTGSEEEGSSSDGLSVHQRVLLTEYDNSKSEEQGSCSGDGAGVGYDNSTASEEECSSSGDEAGVSYDNLTGSEEQGSSNSDGGEKHPSTAGVKNFDRVRRALQAYKSMKGNLQVPYSFIIPTNDALWETESDLWGFQLGITVNNIRNNNHYKSQRAELEEMGFKYDRQQYGWDLVKRALQAYEKKRGNLLVPYLFMIPLNSSSWHEDLWGIFLGSVVKNIRNDNEYGGHRAELEEMGFDYIDQNFRKWEKAKKALLAYEAIYGDMEVPRKFIIPDNISWEESLWGVRLGQKAYDIRKSKSFKSRRQELIEMGFFGATQRG